MCRLRTLSNSEGALRSPCSAIRLQNQIRVKCARLNYSDPQPTYPLFQSSRDLGICKFQYGHKQLLTAFTCGLVGLEILTKYRNFVLIFVGSPKKFIVLFQQLKFCDSILMIRKIVLKRMTAEKTETR